MALGDVDELNAAIGLAREHCTALTPSLLEQLIEVQSRLLDVGAAVATPTSSSTAERLARVEFEGDHHTAQLEGWIDAMDDALPPLKNFILPVRDCCFVTNTICVKSWLQSGGLASAQLHVARTVARRAERRLVTLVRDGHLAPDVAVYVNRLSDYLFVAARYAAMKAGATELIYKKSEGLKPRTSSRTAEDTPAGSEGTSKRVETDDKNASQLL
jgi:cob(I)alamin adenosyltransferase